MELNKTIQHFFHQPHLDVVDIDEIRRATERYPYVGALQLLLLKKQQQLKLTHDDGQYAKAALFVPNIYQIDSVLRDRSQQGGKSSPFVKEMILIEQDVEVSGADHDEEENFSQNQEPTFEGTHPDIYKEEMSLPEQENVEPEIVQAFIKEHQPEIEPWQKEEQQPSLEAAAKEEQSAGIDYEHHSMADIETEEFSDEQHDNTPEPPLRTDLLRMESPIPIPSLRDISPQTDEMPVFEPYHTIDYFASQGIKLGQDIKPGDKLGRQLKSFTEWIRTMKRLPNTEIEQQLLDTSNGDNNIVAMAAGSVEMKEVVTETMAEVLVKQGNKARAIDIYRKLSLAYPDKSAYFAAQIENIKHR